MDFYLGTFCIMKGKMLADYQRHFSFPETIYIKLRGCYDLPFFFFFFFERNFRCICVTDSVLKKRTIHINFSNGVAIVQHYIVQHCTTLYNIVKHCIHCSTDEDSCTLSQNNYPHLLNVFDAK